MTYFQVTAEHLKIAQGNVRCGHCRNVFSALGNLTEKLPEPTAPEPEQSASQNDKHSDTDFLTDEELEEFEDFDTNIYDDEDSIFDAFIDDDSDDTFQEEITVDDSRGKHPPQDKKEIVAAAQKAEKPAIPIDKEKETPQAKPSKKLTSLEEGQKANLAKLQQTKLTDPEVSSKPKQTPTTSLPEEVLPEKNTPVNTAVETSISETTPNHAETAKAETGHTATDKTVQRDTLLDVRHTLTRKPDIPVQSSGEEVDFDTALQAIDELEINDEHAEFVASVVKEFEATSVNKLTPPRKAANRLKSVAAAASQRIKPGAAEKPAAKPPKPPKTSKPAIQAPPAQTQGAVNEALIPTLPAILREGYQQEAVHHRLTPAAIGWGLGSLLLMLFFLGQTLYFKHDQLAQVSTFRPWIESFCRHFDCEIALQYDARQLELLGQDIRSHPDDKNALLVSTTIINNAPYRQAYPGLQLTFTDMNGEKVAMRRFLPEEYLPRGTIIKQGMPPETPIQVVMELMDPGSNAINFEFEFFKAI